MDLVFPVLPVSTKQRAPEVLQPKLQQSARKKESQSPGRPTVDRMMAYMEGIGRSVICLSYTLMFVSHVFIFQALRKPQIFQIDEHPSICDSLRYFTYFPGHGIVIPEIPFKDLQFMSSSGNSMKRTSAIK